MNRPAPRSTPVVLLLLLLWVTALPAVALEWGWDVGLHDMAVPEADSRTAGVNASVLYRHEFGSGATVAGSATALVDDDEDELDPEHVPLWFLSSHRYEHLAHRWSRSTALLWFVDLAGKRNTVSSVEWQVKAFPAVMIRSEGDRSRVSASAGVGYYFLEIDDDVPTTRGYTRDDLRNHAAAVWLRADLEVRIGRRWDLSGAVGYWADGDTRLETQYSCGLAFDTGDWIERTQVGLTAELTAYDLDPYPPTDPAAPGVQVPIVPWDHDVLVRLAFARSW
jgi:hypothetical protein